MTEQNHKSPYEQGIYHEMQLKETDELLMIWQENNRADWTDEVFEAVREILLERLGEVPQRGVFVRGAESSAMDRHEDSVEDSREVNQWLSLAIWLERAAWGVGLLAFYNILVRVVMFFQRLSDVDLSGDRVIFILTSLVNIFDNLIMLGFISFTLLAFSEILYLLGDIQMILEPKDTKEINA